MSDRQPLSLAELKFSELDNWLGIMEVDPPTSREEKQVMYDRLLDILADTFEPNNYLPIEHLNKTTFRKQMRKIIDR